MVMFAMTMIRMMMRVVVTILIDYYNFLECSETKRESYELLSHIDTKSGRYSSSSSEPCQCVLVLLH